LPCFLKNYSKKHARKHARNREKRGKTIEILINIVFKISIQTKKGKYRKNYIYI